MWWGTLMGDGKEHERIFEVLKTQLISPYGKSKDDYWNYNKSEVEK